MNLYLLCNSCNFDRLDAWAKLRLDYGADAGLHFAIQGPEIPLSGSAGTWSAVSGSGGYPHDYRWYVDGNYAGSGAKYSSTVGAQDFDLRADLTDVYGRVATQTMHVDVDGIRSSLSGPHMVYLSEGGGTWVGGAVGGHPPYSYDWFVDGQATGDGNSWTGYPGEGFHEVAVRVHDTQGAVYWARLEVDGIGNGTCAPPPGAELCE